MRTVNLNCKKSVNNMVSNERVRDIFGKYFDI